MRCMRDLRHGGVIGEAAQATRPFRDLGHHAARHGRPEQMGFAADPGREVEERAIGREPCVTGLEIPIRRQVDRCRVRSGIRPGINDPHEQVAWSAVIELLIDHHVGAERPRVGEVLAVW